MDCIFSLHTFYLISRISPVFNELRLTKHVNNAESCETVVFMSIFCFGSGFASPRATGRHGHIVHAHVTW